METITSLAATQQQEDSFGLIGFMIAIGVIALVVGVFNPFNAKWRGLSLGFGFVLVAAGMIALKNG